MLSASAGLTSLQIYCAGHEVRSPVTILGLILRPAFPVVIAAA
jgi:hypothetical protein